MNSVTVVNKSSDTGLKIILIILGLLFVVGLILVYVFEKHYSDCKTLESPLCLTGNCPAQSTNCGNAPFKIINSGNTTGYQCKQGLVNQQTIPAAQFQNQ
jgi:hypothetical protein